MARGRDNRDNRDNRDGHPTKTPLHPLVGAFRKPFAPFALLIGCI